MKYFNSNFYLTMLKVIILLFLISQLYCEEINIMILGKVGSGKSTLVNNIMGQTVANVGHYDTGTYAVQKYSIEKFGHTFNIFDTPGLFDANINMDDIFKQYNRVKKINLFLICFDVSQPRVYDTDIEVFRRLKYGYSNSIMDHSIVVLTKSNLLRGTTDEKRKIMDNKFAKLNTTLLGIAAYDSTQLTNLSGNNWIDVMWYHMADKSRNNGYILEANHIRTRVCKPAKDMLSFMKNNKVYPRY